MFPNQRKVTTTYRAKGSRGKRSSARGGISLLLFIVFAIKVYVDGNWGVAIASWSLDYVVSSLVTILIWIAAIFALPAIVVLVWWVTRGRNKQHQIPSF